MPGNYTPTPTVYPGTAMSLLVDGDALNRDGLYKELTPGATPKGTIALAMDYIAGLASSITTATTVTRVQMGLILVSDGTTTMPLNNFAAGNVPAGGGAAQAIHVPNGSTITGISLRLVPAVHVSIAGINLPSLDLRRVDVTTGTDTQIATVTDTSATAGAYSAAHTISITGQTEVADTTKYYYYAQIGWESGGGAAVDGSIEGVRATYSAPAVPVGF